MGSKVSGGTGPLASESKKPRRPLALYNWISVGQSVLICARDVQRREKRVNESLKLDHRDIV